MRLAAVHVVPQDVGQPHVPLLHREPRISAHPGAWKGQGRVVAGSEGRGRVQPQPIKPKSRSPTLDALDLAVAARGLLLLLSGILTGRVSSCATLNALSSLPFCVVASSSSTLRRRAGLGDRGEKAVDPKRGLLALGLRRLEARGVEAGLVLCTRALAAGLLDRRNEAKCLKKPVDLLRLAMAFDTLSGCTRADVSPRVQCCTGGAGTQLHAGHVGVRPGLTEAPRTEMSTGTPTKRAAPSLLPRVKLNAAVAVRPSPCVIPRALPCKNKVW